MFPVMAMTQLLAVEQSIMNRYSSGDFDKDLTMSTFALKQALFETHPRHPVDTCAETSSPSSIFSGSTEAPDTPDLESEDEPQPLPVSDVVASVDDGCGDMVLPEPSVDSPAQGGAPKGEDMVLPEPSVDSPAKGIKRRLVILGSRSVSTKLQPSPRSESPNSAKTSSPCADMFDPFGAEDTDAIDTEDTPEAPRKLQQQTRFGHSCSPASRRKLPAAKPQQRSATTAMDSIVKPATMTKITIGTGSWKSLADSITMPPPCTKPWRKKKAHLHLSKSAVSPIA